MLYIAQESLFFGPQIAVLSGMRFLLIFLAIPGMALAKGPSRKLITPQAALPVSGAPALLPPYMLQPQPGYPVNGQLGNYQLPVNAFGQSPALLPGQYQGAYQPGMYPPGMYPQIPGYLAHYNRGIPGFGGTGQPQTAFNVLKYGQPQSANRSPMSGGGGAGGSGGSNPLSQLFNQMANPSNGVKGSPYSGDSGDGGSSRPDGRPVNSGPDGLCRPGKNLFQTTARPELGGISPCDTIYNTITQDSCTAEYADQLGRQETRDMENFCPGWNRIKGDPTKRALALMNLVAAVVRTESGWRNGATGDGGKSRGLLQLTSATDQKHRCSCSQLNDEFNMQQNLRCGTQMIVSFMARDRAVGHGTGEHCGGDASGCGAQGIARSFGPFRDGRGQRADIQRRISQWCRESLDNATPPPEAAGKAPGVS